MRYTFFILIIVFCQSCNNKSDLEQLRDFGINLKKFNSFEYDVEHRVYRSYVDKTTIRKGKAYFAKNSTDTLVGFDYYFEIERKLFQFVTFYGGDKEINLRLNDSMAYFRDLRQFPKQKMINQPLFEESILSIRKWIEHDSLYNNISGLISKDTIIQNKECKLFIFDINQNDYFWWYNKPNMNDTTNVKITFSIDNYFPLFMHCKENLRNNEYHLIDVRFSNFKNVKYDDKKLSIENVPEYFRWGLKKEKLNKNLLAPNFKLPVIADDSIELYSLRDNYILLQFGFIGCGPCKASIPIINQIKQKYEDKNLLVYGINLYCNNPDKIEEYKIKSKMQYDLLWSDSDIIAKQYKVSSAPCFYLIDKEGKIIYSSNGLNEKELKFELYKIFGT